MGIEDLDVVIPPWLTADPWEREVRQLLVSMDREVDAIVVEGPNDTSALRAGGVETHIAECARCRNLDHFADELAGGPIAILTDFDDHGRRLNGRLRDLLPDHRVESRWRREVGLLLTQRGRYDIESLNNVFEPDLAR